MTELEENDALAGLVAWRAEVRRADEDLRWDGEAWSWGGVAVRPHVALDLGGWMLLRLTPGAPGLRGRWLPLSSRRAGPHWAALRAALYASAERRAVGTEDAER